MKTLLQTNLLVTIVLEIRLGRVATMQADEHNAPRTMLLLQHSHKTFLSGENIYVVGFGRFTFG